jgi:hypothetical protein
VCKDGWKIKNLYNSDAVLFTIAARQSFAARSILLLLLVGCIDSGMHTTDYHKIINNECCNQICTHKDRRNQDSNAQLIVTIQDAMHKMMLDALASKKNLNNVLPDTTGHPIKDSNPLISSADGLPVAPLLELDTLIGHSFTL